MIYTCEIWRAIADYVMLFGVITDAPPIDPVTPQAAGAQAISDPTSRNQPAIPEEKSHNFRPIYWLAIPVLAIAAYVTVLRIGFLSDDFILLDFGSSAPSWFHFIGSDQMKVFY